MQSVKHESQYRNAHWLLDEVEMLYADLSSNADDSGKLVLSTYDSSLQPIFNVFQKYAYDREFPNLCFENKDVKPLKLPKYDPKNIIVCYSGGKDSLSVVKHYIDMGYNVYAYHIKGLNKTYIDEWEVAEKAADVFGFKLIIENMSYIGNHSWVEHPMKNMIMANMALSYGISHNITTKIACGSFYSAHLDDIEFDVCAGDTIDMWHIYEDVVKRFIPRFHIYVPNKNMYTSYNMILRQPELLKYTISCLTPYRFRKLFKKRTENNYSVKLMNNRCGCCWKCAVEYIWFCDHNILEYNKEYYIHCIEILTNTMEQEMGYRTYNIDHIWKNYIFYPMKKSKAYEELKNAIILSGKIKITSNSIER